LLRLCERVASRARASGQVGRTVSIKVRFADFSTVSRSKTLGSASDVAKEIFETATALYTALGLDRARIRLLGVKLDGLAKTTEVARQLAFGDREHGWREAENAADAATRRFGSGAVTPASLVSRRIPPPVGGARQD
jgi:DNA polymerase-4